MTIFFYTFFGFLAIKSKIDRKYKNKKFKSVFKFIIIPLEQSVNLSKNTSTFYVPYVFNKDENSQYPILMIPY